MPYRAGATVNDGLTTNPKTISVPVPAGAQAGDLALVFLTWNLGVAQTLTAPAGWDVVQYATGPPQAWCFSRLLTAGDLGTSPTWTGSVGGELIAAIIVYSGVSSAAPVNASAQVINGSSANQAGPAVTSTVAGCTIVDSWHLRTGSTGVSFSETAPATHTERAQANSAFGGTSQNVGLLVAELTASPVTPGTYGPYTAHINGATPAACGIAVALTPAPTSTVYDLAASGVLALSAPSPVVLALRDVRASGSLTPAGTATPARLLDVRGAGQLAPTGTASAGQLLDVRASGTLTLTGPAPGVGSVLTVTGAGQLAPFSNVAQVDRLADVRAAGQLAVTGMATPGDVLDVRAAGTLTLTGSAAVAVIATAGASGVLALAGSAGLGVITTVSASGTLTLTGQGAPAARRAVTASGTLTLTGSAYPELETAAPQVYDIGATGRLTPTGTAAPALRRAVAASGRLVPTGPAAPAALTASVTASGALTLTGAAAAVLAVETVAASGRLTLTGRASFADTLLLAAAGLLALSAPQPELADPLPTDQDLTLVFAGPYRLGSALVGPIRAVPQLDGPRGSPTRLTGGRGIVNPTGGPIATGPPTDGPRS